jgi:hypothetical protein
MDINVIFCRRLLGELRRELYKHKVRPMADASVTNSGRFWFFEGPNGFYWEGTADNAYDARYKGWCAWLEKEDMQAAVA